MLKINSNTIDHIYIIAKNFNNIKFARNISVNKTKKIMKIFHNMKNIDKYTNTLNEMRRQINITKKQSIETVCCIKSSKKNKK